MNRPSLAISPQPGPPKLMGKPNGCPSATAIEAPNTPGASMTPRATGSGVTVIISAPLARHSSPTASASSITPR